MLRGRRILLGVSGGVAAFKAAYLARRLMESGAEVRSIMTASAGEFLGPQTLAAITGSFPQQDLFGAQDVSPHTEMAAWADLIVIAPATAATLSRLATGLSEDLLSTTALAFTGPVVVAPAMHTEMWENAATQRNVDLLAADGVILVGPESGALAGGDVGPGRMAEPEQIVAAITAALGEGSMAGVRILVSAGGTREPIDPVRYLGNRSSGKMGTALAEEAAARGAHVTLVTTASLDVDQRVDQVQVETADEMADAVWARAADVDVMVLAAAVADFKPDAAADGKLRRADGAPQVNLIPTPDILAGIAQQSPRPYLVGFAAETGPAVNAVAKATSKGVDLLVANDVTQPDAGFGTDTNRVTIIRPDGSTDDWPVMSKRQVAATLGSDSGRASLELTRTVRVVPDVPSFSVDDGFAYSVPEDLSLEIGAIVRVPLGGRRVRGWVVAIGDGDDSKLRAVLSRSGDLAVFDRRFLDVMRWAAVRYVAPLAALLAKATPPNIPRRRSWKDREPPALLPAGQLATLSSELAVGKRPGTEVWLGGGPWAQSIASVIAPALAAGRNGLVVTATVAENEALTADLQAVLGDCVISSASGGTGAQQTKAWVEAATRPGTLVVGTRAAGFWHIADLAAAFVVGEGRRGMKDKSTPTTHVREVLVKRSQMERFGLVLCGTVPTAEALAAGSARRIPETGRMWGQVEVVDRRTEDSDGALLGPTARAALRSAVTQETPVLLFTHRRATAQRCARCKALRKCGTCGSGSFESGECSRCGARSEACDECEFARFEMMGSGASRVAAEAGRVIGRENVGEPGSGRLVVVGTERDLPGLSTGLTIIVDADGPILAPTYRAAEDALRLLARAIGVAGSGRGRRGLIQTSDPSHPVIEALRRADPLPFLRQDSDDRAAAGFPPGGEVLVLEVEDPPAAASAELDAAVGKRAEILGPADSGGRVRWLLQGKDLSAARVALRAVVSRWREGGARVRIDADPVDL